MSLTNMILFAAWEVPYSVKVGLAVCLLLLGLFLILLVLIQRGKGGGLAGAFGGAGGSSAFGSRAGDTFTRITIYVAAGWLLLIMILIKTTQLPAVTPVAEGVNPPAGAPTAPLEPTPPDQAPPPGS